MVKRYDLHFGGAEGDYIDEVEDGDYVSHDDYAVLKARVAELERELSDAESDIDTMACQILELTRGESND